MELKPINKKGQGGFNLIIPIVIAVVVAGILLAVMGGVFDSLDDSWTLNSTEHNVTDQVGGAVSDFAGNFGTFFSLALLAVILGIVGIFLIRNR